MKRCQPDPKNPRRFTGGDAAFGGGPDRLFGHSTPGDEFFSKATPAWPPARQQLTIRLDADVLQWLKANGRGYQTRINRILRAAMESQPSGRSHATAAQKKAVPGKA